MNTSIVPFSLILETQVEWWRPIEGFPGYEVSSLGRVRSFWQRGLGKGHGRGWVLSDIPQRFVSYHYDQRGYPRMGMQGEIRTKGRHPFMRVHRAVALAFIENPENKPQVNHKNGIKVDNRVDNLEWATRSENMKHAFASHLFGSREGSKANPSILHESVIPIIREMLANGEHKRNIGKRFGVTADAIYDIQRGRSWTHVP